MQYDTQWTPQERARVEALRLVLGRPIDGLNADEIVSMAGRFSAFIAGPEATRPYPWDRSAEAHKRLDELMWRGPDGRRVNTRMHGDQLTVTYAELSEVLNLLPGEEPPW